VVFGYTVRVPALHVACNHQFHSVQLALREMARRGYRRIGFVVLQSYHERVDSNWLAGYLATQAALPQGRRIPPLVLPGWEAKAVASWVRQHRPDAILTRHVEINEVLARMKLKIPRDIGVAFMNVPDRSGGRAGIYEDLGRIGAGAIEWLIDLVRRNQRGIPAIPQRLMFEGEWVDGVTVRSGRARLRV
jgi:hypothetical protein